MEQLRTSILEYLSPVFGQLSDAVYESAWSSVQEIRLRVGAPLTFSSATGNTSFGKALTAHQVWDCFFRLCGQAVHTHQEELRQGFVTAKGGIRVGVAGTAVLSGGKVSAYRDITSLCIRVPRVVTGCGKGVLPYIDTDDGIKGLLLCGAPASGKTTMLRDLAQSLSRRRRVAVVDERCELSLGGLPMCDVLSGCPKASGILQAVRTLAPDAVIADELGDAEEWRAVEHSLYGGVPVIASVHASCVRELAAREEIVRVLRRGGFTHVAVLPPRTARHTPITIRKAAELLEDAGSVADRACVYGSGIYRGTPSDGDTAPVAGLGGSAVPFVYGASLYGASDTGAPRRIG